MIPSPSAPLQKAGERFHGLDAVRAAALLLGVIFHSIASFPFYMRKDWLVGDSQQSVVLDVQFYVLHVFRMQAFFLVAGFFAHQLYHRQGRQGFVQNRLRRILLPFLVFMPLMQLVNFLVRIWIQHRSQVGGATRLYWQLVHSEGADWRWFTENYSLQHLWFLWFLVLFYGIVLVVRPIVVRVDPYEQMRQQIDLRVARVMEKWWGALGLTLLIVTPMAFMKGGLGVDWPFNLVPEPAPFVLYGVFFTLGWFFHRQTGLIDLFRMYWRVNAIIALVLITAMTVVFISVAHAVVDSSPAKVVDKQVLILIVVTLNVLYAFASMTAVFAFIGGIITLFSRPSRQVRYLADASYWMYLIHLFVVLLIQTAIAPYNWPWPVKVLLILTGTLSVCLLTYQYGVRNTWLGGLLNGRRYSPSQSPIMPSAESIIVL